MTGYSVFEENGYKFETFIPSDRTEPREWLLVVTKDGEKVRELRVPMSHAPVFGPDLEDVAALERAADPIIKEFLGE